MKLKRNIEKGWNGLIGKDGEVEGHFYYNHVWN